MSGVEGDPPDEPSPNLPWELIEEVLACYWALADHEGTKAMKK